MDIFKVTPAICEVNNKVINHNLIMVNQYVVLTGSHMLDKWHHFLNGNWPLRKYMSHFIPKIFSKGEMCSRSGYNGIFTDSFVASHNGNTKTLQKRRHFLKVVDTAECVPLYSDTAVRKYANLVWGYLSRVKISEIRLEQLLMTQTNIWKCN